MKHIFNKTFLYVENLGIKEVESTEVDINNIIYSMDSKKNLIEKRTFRRLKRDFRGRTIRKSEDCWIID